jgi:hypothetical protein
MAQTLGTGQKQALGGRAASFAIEHTLRIQDSWAGLWVPPYRFGSVDLNMRVAETGMLVRRVGNKRMRFSMLQDANPVSMIGFRGSIRYTFLL